MLPVEKSPTHTRSNQSRSSKYLSVYNDKLQSTTNEVHKPFKSQDFDDYVLQYWYSWNGYGSYSCSDLWAISHDYIFGSD